MSEKLCSKQIGSFYVSKSTKLCLGLISTEYRINLSISFLLLIRNFESNMQRLYTADLDSFEQKGDVICLHQYHLL